MKQLNLIITLSLCLALSINAQDEELKYLNVNEVYTTINPEGGLFWDGSSRAIYKVPNTGEGTGASAIFAANSWMAMFDHLGNLKGSTVAYSNTGQPLGRIPGMLDQTTGLPFPDDPLAEGRVFSVSRLEIEALLEDLLDGNIDDEIPADILEWPARGNQFYQGMLDNQSAAPFVDQNADGLYNPYDGDIPYIGNSSKENIPDHLLYNIVNDSSSEYAAGIELHTMIYAYFCEENLAINQSVYQRQVIYNRSSQNYSDIHFGHWVDFDLGCSEDDAVGCDSTSNIMYVYNIDDQDGDAGNVCTTGAKTYDKRVFNGRKILNGGFESCHFYGRADGTTLTVFDFTNLGDIYEMLRGNWADGTPMTPYGSGYNPDDVSGVTTKFHYHDNPNDEDAWTSDSYDYRGVGTQYRGHLQAGGFLVFDLVNTFTESSTLDHLEVINLGMDRLNEAAQFRNNGFDSECINDIICEDVDCIYPGDVNNDERVSTHDYMLAAKAVSVDTLLESPRNFISEVWKSYDGNDRSQMFATGVNYKHGDCNGDGKVDENDLDVVMNNFAKKTDYYNPFTAIDCPPYQGSGELELSIPSELTSMSAGTGTSTLVIRDFEGIFAITYSLVYDSDIFEKGLAIYSILPSQLFDAGGYRMYNTDILGEEVYVSATTSGQNSSIPEANPIFRLNLKEDINVSSTEVRLTDIMVMDFDENFYCLDDVVYEIDFTDISSTTELAEDTSISIFPNPTSQDITLTSDTQMTSYALYSLEGKLIKSNNLNATEQRIELGLDEGVYILQVQLEDGKVWNERVVIVE